MGSRAALGPGGRLSIPSSEVGSAGRGPRRRGSLGKRELSPCGRAPAEKTTPVRSGGRAGRRGGPHWPGKGRSGAGRNPGRVLGRDGKACPEWGRITVSLSGSAAHPAHRPHPNLPARHVRASRSALPPLLRPRPRPAQTPSAGSPSPQQAPTWSCGPTPGPRAGGRAGR